MADDVTGKATLLGDRQMKAEGQLEQAEGVAEQDAARAEEALREANLRKAAAQRAQGLNGGA
jgi:uncharacterized protein YjbJ (UPF0337 family)